MIATQGAGIRGRSLIKAVDFFSGCGGVSAGLRAAGIEILAGLDSDPEAARTFRANFPEAAFIERDIRQVPTEALRPLLAPYVNQPLLFSGCAPCQPFSRQNRWRSDTDERALLIAEFGRFVSAYHPRLVFVENVPHGPQQSLRLDQPFRLPQPFRAFIDSLEALGYKYVLRRICAQDYGVPQRRERVVLIANLPDTPYFPDPTHGPGRQNPSYSSVWEWIGDLPALAAGEESMDIPNHRASGLSPLNLRRIRATPEGGSRKDWPEDLQLPCHRRGYVGHSDVYGRLRKDLPASGLTTRCISLSNGRFGHPVQDRALTVREAACLQTFPREFVFHGSMNGMARQVGNAVPVLLAQRFGECFVRTVEADRVSSRDDRTKEGGEHDAVQIQGCILQRQDS